MITVIKKGSSTETVRKKVNEVRQVKKKDKIKEYCGVITLKEDPLKIQKRWRDEWK